MLPNWLYGKSKSKLASILGGGGGTPADYNQVKAQVTQNTEDILLLSDALDDKAALTQITNPNILHNPWFQVNQRGFTTGTTSAYCVDRWLTSIAATGQTTYTLNSDGTLTIDNTLGEAPCYLVQKRTSKTISRVAGRKVTLSVMLSDGTIHSGSGTYNAAATTTYYEDSDIKILSIAQTARQFFVLHVEAGKSITIKALKFELGEVSTLAMDTAPDMATELVKCQRYFCRIDGTSNGYPICVGRAHNTTQGRYLIKLPVEMRSTAAVTVSDLTKVRELCNHQQSTPTAFAAGTMVKGGYMSLYTTTSGLIADELIGLLLNGEYIDISAEL